jgi:hypothetical protein
VAAARVEEKEKRTARALASQSPGNISSARTAARAGAAVHSADTAPRDRIYWRQHPLRADRLARALAALSGAPESWTWRIDKPGSPASFRAPPVPFREESHAKGPGYCCVCGQPVFRFGWHRDLWGDGPNRNAGWHACCVAAWKLWTAPSDHVLHLRRRQKHRCAVTGARLAKNAEVDHRVALFEISRASERGSQTWPALLRYWGAPNLQVINRLAHVEKCGLESAARARLRQASKAPDLSAD